MSAGAIAGIAIGIPVGLVILAIVAWYAGLNKHWENRKSNPHYKSCVACLSGIACTECRSRCQERVQDARVERAASREEREAQIAARREEREAQIAARREEREAERAQREAERTQIQAEREAQMEADRARQAARIQMESMTAGPSAPFQEPQPYPTKESLFSQEGPPQYPPHAIGFQQVAADLPPPYAEATAGIAPYPQ